MARVSRAGSGWITQALMIAVLVMDAAQVMSAEQEGGLLHVLSSRPDTVSGGDTLVEVRAPAETRWSAMLDGHEVTAAFRRSDSGEWVALLTGLREGKNSLEIRESGAVAARVDLIDHPLSGPIFSGPQQQPFICQTVQNGLGPAQDAQCAAKTVVQYYYRSSHPGPVDGRVTWAKALEVLAGHTVDVPVGFKVYDPQSPPTDVASTTLSDGRTVPYIVRREVGVINRAVYDIRFLHEPGQLLPNPWSRNGSSWNGRLVYEFTGGCVVTHRQGTLLAPASHEAILALGYAVATSTLNIFGNSCNDVLSAETASMVKEHFIEEYGTPAHTMGWGESAGAVQQYLIAQNYPGLIDGVISYISFPDMITYLPTLSDCTLLRHAFDKAKHPWTEEQKSAVSGFATWRVCLDAAGEGYGITPGRCDPAIAPADVYDSRKYPKGVRCTIYDNEIAVFGRDPRTGFAARPLDNVGVQYGLEAFNEGKLDAEQFVELNELVGGYDDDGNIIARRTEARVEAIRRAYRNGVVFTGGGGLAQTPIIDWRWYSDDQGDNHDIFRSYSARARLIAANGTASNQVILIDPPANTSVMTLTRLSDPNPEVSRFARRERDLVTQMDRWLDNVVADVAPDSHAAKVARDKPKGLVDSCMTVDGERIVDTTTGDVPRRCKQLYPPHGDTRIAAGGPLTDDVLKCSLKRVGAADYAHALSAEQLGRLRNVFPAGVCDYSRPGVGQEVTRMTWQSYPDPNAAVVSQTAARAGH